MTPHPYALRASRKVLRLLIVLNWLIGTGILALLVASLMDPQWVFTALRVGSGEGSAGVISGMRQIMLIGLLSVPLTHIVLARLLEIVETVREGDPFVAANAARLKLIAWVILGLELLHLAVGLIAAMASSETATLDIDWNFSFTRWLAVLLLFVLASVFDHGARMRDELEGTV